MQMRGHRHALALSRKPHSCRSGVLKSLSSERASAELEAAKTLRRVPVDVTIIDRHNYHCFQPLLYQVATAALSPAEIAWPIRYILRQQKNVTVLMAEVTGIDAPGRVVATLAGHFPFDFLVIATGAADLYFGHDDWAVFAPASRASRTPRAFAVVSSPLSSKRNLPKTKTNAGGISHS